MAVVVYQVSPRLGITYERMAIMDNTYNALAVKVIEALEVDLALGQNKLVEQKDHVYAALDAGKTVVEPA